MADSKKPMTKVVAQNKKAYHDYFVDEKYEAGIALFGTEVKSIRQGAVNLKDCYCSIKNGELFVVGMHISPYDHGNIFLNRKGESIDKVFELLKGKIYYAHLKNLLRTRDYTYMATHLEAGHIDNCKVLAKLKEELKSGIFAIEYACSGDGVIAAKRDMDYIRFLRTWLGI